MVLQSPVYNYNKEPEGVVNPKPLLRGSWDLVTRVIIKVTIVLINYNYL